MDLKPNADLLQAPIDDLHINGDDRMAHEQEDAKSLDVAVGQITLVDDRSVETAGRRRTSSTTPSTGSERPDFSRRRSAQTHSEVDVDVKVNEAKLGKILTLIPLPTLVLDKNLNVIHASDSHLNLSGYSRNEYRGRRIYDLPPHKIPAPDVQTIHHAITSAIATNTVQTIDDIDADFGRTSYSLRVTPIFEAGSLLYLTLTAQQVLRSKPARKNKHEHLYIDETYRILVDTVKDYAIFMLDTKGNVSTWNSGAAILKGYSAEEVIGQHFSMFYGRDDRIAGKPVKELEVCLREGRVEDEGWRYRKDGTRFWANTMLTPVYRQGEHVGFAKVTRDLTERKAAEGRLIAAFEESSNLKSDFLANMSHEIRTPMHGMLLALTMLTSTNLDEKQREYAAIIEDSGSVLLQIINDVLDYSKISSGTFSITPDVLDVEVVINAVVRNCKSSLKPGVTLETHVQPGFPKHVKGDPLRYRQIMQNLVGNAVKFTEHGSVKIHTTFKQHEEDENSYEIRSEVIDTGIGVPDDSTSALFTPFGRFANTSLKLYQGAGLGLSICKSLAELMDGSVGFYSNPDGQGSVFWFTARMSKFGQGGNGLSAPQPQPQSQSPSPDPNAEIARIAPRKQLLLVEDNIMNQTIMLKLLNMIGFEKVDTAWDGAEAVRKVKQKPLSYNTILMDINMPVMDGVEATVAIRKINSEVPIIAMTGNALKGDAETYLAKGMSDYVAKPVHRQHLVKVLLKWIGI
jgi:osomolarity two-component system sensor histidine kinase TcsA